MIIVLLKKAFQFTIKLLKLIFIKIPKQIWIILKAIFKFLKFLFVPKDKQQVGKKKTPKKKTT